MREKWKQLAMLILAGVGVIVLLFFLWGRALILHYWNDSAKAQIAASYLAFIGATLMLLANILLVFVTVMYAYANSRLVEITAAQARSAKEQADAADKQAAAASESIKLVQGQMADQVALNVIQTATSLRRMSADIDSWGKLLWDKWGVLPEFHPFLPEQWANMVYVIGKNVPGQEDRLRTIEEKLIAATQKIKEQLGRDKNFRQSEAFRAGAQDLRDTYNPLYLVLTEVERKISSMRAIS